MDWIVHWVQSWAVMMASSELYYGLTDGYVRATWMR